MSIVQRYEKGLTIPCTHQMCTLRNACKKDFLTTSPHTRPFPAYSVRCVQENAGSVRFCCTHEIRTRGQDKSRKKPGTTRLFPVGVMSVDTHTKQDNSLPIFGDISTKSFDYPQVFATFGNNWESSVIDVIPNVPTDTEQKTEQW